MFERFDPPLIPNPGPDDLAGAKARWAARRRRVVLALSGTSAVVVVALAALLAPSFASGDHQEHVTSAGRATTTTQPAPSTTTAPTTSTTVRRRPVTTIAPPPTTARATTRVETYSPWTSQGKLAPGIVVSQRISGTSCDMTSSFDSSPYAWRCSTADGGFYDPCFAPMGVNATEVACPNDPWSPVIMVTLSQPLANPYSATTKPRLDVPWAMLLANGERCLVIHGTGTQIGRTMFNYGCGPGYGTEPDRKTEPWTISHSPSESGPITSVVVNTAWI